MSIHVSVCGFTVYGGSIIRMDEHVKERNTTCSEGCSIVYSRSGAKELICCRKDSACCLLRQVVYKDLTSNEQ